MVEAEAPAVTVALFPYFDWGATLLWATTGAMLGARRGYDLLGVFIIALASAAGGGLLRDGIFLQQGPPALVRSPVDLGLIVVATLAVLIFGRYLRTRRWLDMAELVADAMGLGAYAVVGMQLAIAAHLAPVGVILVGVVNAVGGSVLRDVLIGDEVQLLKPGVFMGMASLLGCALFLSLLQLRVGHELAGALTVALVFAVRALAVRFDLRSRPLGAFEEDWRKHDEDGGSGKH